MRATCRRRHDGQAIRDAMSAKGWTLIALAGRTAELDPSGLGVSYQLIGFLTADGTSARETTSPRSADLIAQALDVPRGTLFEDAQITLETSSAATRKAAAATARAALPQPARLDNRTARPQDHPGGVPFPLSEESIQ